MIRFSISIQRGCFGGCTFCSITEHEGRIIQNRSEDSVIREIETIRDTVPGFTGVISDLGGPTANMYRIACKSPAIESACRRPSCVYPGICPNLNTDHTPLIRLYRRARELSGIKKVLIASGVRYDLAIESPAYVKELAQHHVGGYLKIAPEALAEGPLSKMMKPGVGTYYRFKELFEKYSKEVGKEQYLIPYFIAAHPGTSDEDMLELALWLKKNGFRADQVQAFLPSPMATATAMYHSGKNPLKRVTHTSEEVRIPKGIKVRRLHKAFLRYHDPDNWPVLREALRHMGRADLIGNGKHQLIPAYQPTGTGNAPEGRRARVRRGRSEPNTPASPGRRPCRPAPGQNKTSLKYSAGAVAETPSLRVGWSVVKAASLRALVVIAGAIGMALSGGMPVAFGAHGHRRGRCVDPAGNAAGNQRRNRTCHLPLCSPRDRVGAKGRQQARDIGSRHSGRPRHVHARHHSRDSRVIGAGRDICLPAGRTGRQRRDLHPVCQSYRGDGARDESRRGDARLDWRRVSRGA